MGIYKDLKRMYFLLGGLGGVMLALSLSFLKVGSLFVQCAAAAVWVLAVNIYLNRIAGQRLMKLRSLLADCKCREFILAIEKLRSGTKKTEKWLEFDLAQGYLTLGNYEKAREILKAVPLRNDGTRIDIVEQLYINSNLVSVYIGLKEIAAAEKVLMKMDQLLEYPVLSDAQKAAYRSAYVNRQIVLDIEKGEYEGNKETLVNLLSREKTILGKVTFRYYLALIYIYEHNETKAKECLDDVVENGGDCRFVAMAKEKLENLPTF